MVSEVPSWVLVMQSLLPTVIDILSKIVEWVTVISGI